MWVFCKKGCKFLSNVDSKTCLLAVRPKRLSVLVHFASPAFSIFKWIIYCNLNSPLCELISCVQPDVAQIQMREATESTELFYILRPFLLFPLKSICRRTLIQIKTQEESNLSSDVIFGFKTTLLPLVLSTVAIPLLSPPLSPVSIHDSVLASRF